MPYRDKEKKRINSRAWAKAHPHSAKKASQKWYLANKDRVNASASAWKKSHKEQISARHKEKTYGLTEEGFEVWWTAQGGRCPICLREMLRTGTKSASVCVDHDHSDNHIRGLLCRRCNLLLGMGGDTLQMFERAVDYLRRTLGALCP